MTAESMTNRNLSDRQSMNDTSREPCGETNDVIPGSKMTVNRRDFLKGVSGIAGAGVGASLLSREARAQNETNEPTGGTVNIGFLAALSGDSAGWGLPGLTGNQIFIDQVNAKGGLLVGGKRYLLKMYAFDDEGIGSKALQGAKSLVLQNDVKFISAIGGASADTTHPFLTEHKVMYAPLAATDIRPDRPYLIAGGDVYPRIDMLRPWYAKWTDPKLKRWAAVCQDDVIGLVGQAWEVAGAKSEGWDVVYNKHYSLETTDFAPVATAVLASKPDVVSLSLSYPTFVTLLIEQLYLQGFKGKLSANYFDTEAILQKLPAEYIEGAVDSYPLFDDPWWGDPSQQSEFTRQWIKNYGPGAPEDVHRHMVGVDWDHMILLQVWAHGAELAGSFDPDAILTALRAAETIPTILGPAKMTGKEMWGIDNMVSPPIPICEVRGGVKRVQSVVRYEQWFESRKDQLIGEVRAEGQMWDQRK